MANLKKYMTSIIKASGNEFAGIAADGISYADVTDWMDTGSLALNALFSGTVNGGFASNKITALAGESGVGKTYVALSVCKTFLEQNKDAIVVYFDTEAAVSKEMLVERGIDVMRFIPIAVETIQEFRTQAVRILDEHVKTPEDDRPKMLMVLDSLGMLSTGKERDDIEKGNDTRDMTRTQLIRGTFRVLTLKLGRANVPLILTNHVYTVTGAYVPTQEMSGGGGVKYAASTICYLSKKKERDADKNVIGVILKAKLVKGRQTKENSEVSVLLRYDSGLNRYYGLLEIALDLGLVKKAPKGYEFSDGTKAYEKDIIANPEKYFTPELLKSIDDGCGNLFKYGRGVERVEHVDEEPDGED